MAPQETSWPDWPPPGNYWGQPQPTQKMFETLLWHQILQLDPDKVAGLHVGLRLFLHTCFYTYMFLHTCFSSPVSVNLFLLTCFKIPDLTHLFLFTLPASPPPVPGDLGGERVGEDRQDRGAQQVLEEDVQVAKGAPPGEVLGVHCTPW